MSNSSDRRIQPAPIIAGPYSRGFEREFRLEDDADHVIRINQRQPSGLPRKLAEFVAVAGITQPEAFPHAQAFIFGSNRFVELERMPDNPYDPNAIAVHGSWDADGASHRARLGYIPAAVAAELATLGRDMPIGATIKVMYAPAVGRVIGIRLDVWGPRRKAGRPTEQPQRQDILVPTDPVRRNVLGIDLEAKGLIDNAIECYEANVLDGFDGNHAYDRLAIIYRRRGEVDKELAVLRRAIDVFERLQATPRSDVAPKLGGFKQRYEATLAKSHEALNRLTRTGPDGA